LTENLELTGRLEAEKAQSEQLLNDLLILQTRRYVVETRDVEHVSEARLMDIEMQLFRSI